MPERYVDAILKYLADRDYQPLKPRQLARQMGVAEEDYGTFRQAVKQLRDAGRIVIGSKNALTLPDLKSKVVGFYRPNPRGFGFVAPEEPNAHGDLFIPPGKDGGAMAGDLVVAKVASRGKRGGERVFAGQITSIVRRGENRFVGTLQQSDGHWFVLPDGTAMITPIVIRDVSAAGPKAGSKVVAEITEYPKKGDLPVGVIVERLGEGGRTEVETLAVIRAHGLEDEFSDEALDEARDVTAAFDPADPGQRAGREDLTDRVVATIDPVDARDYDDAISVEPHPDGGMTLGVHIADVSHFVTEGGKLDADAHQRSTSTYFPRKVIPMLPEILSNGVCSLQEGQDRFAKSVFISYDAEGARTGARFAESVIRSSKRLTYEEAQGICDGESGGFASEIVELVKNMETLAKRIEKRRYAAGMLHLDLPGVELVFDEDDKVIDAAPEDDAYSHTIIEMFMVEANEVVAELFDRKQRPILRRIHPDPDQTSGKQLTAFVRACGYKLPRNLSRRDMQSMLAKVKDRPESYAVNLAILKMFEQAEYSPMQIGHFALASEHYCHFTSPIRRYPDLTVHRLLAEHCRGELESRPPEDVSELVRLGEHCSTAERRSEAAERELREVLVLQYLATKIGEEFEGVITGVANFGLFVQSPRFLVEGLVRLQDLGDDWWEVSSRYGQVRGEATGTTFRIGDAMTVRIVAVDLARRELDLKPVEKKGKKPAKGKGGKKRGAPRGRAKGRGRRKRRR